MPKQSPLNEFSLPFPIYFKSGQYAHPLAGKTGTELLDLDLGEGWR